MADLLADVGELSAFIGEELDEDAERLLIELATASVQAAAGQRIVQVLGDQVELIGTTHPWLPLPERPITEVFSVEIDGVVVTDFTLIGSQLWRRQGWVTSLHQPSAVKVVYSHGYPPGDQGLQFAKSAALMGAAQINDNPIGATGFGIDDYREQFSQAAGGGAGADMPEPLRKALRRKYGAGVWTLATR